MDKGTLYLVATPIGNLGDLSARAIEVLKSADFIAAEDTRRTRVLCGRFDIKTPLESYHDYSGEGKRAKLLSWLESGKTVALVSDSGSPLIADPGFKLVREAIRREIPLTTVPGPTAVIGALSLSGFPTDRFIFEGFLPPKSGPRRKRLVEIQKEPRTVIYYESPYRLLKTLTDIESVLPEREICVVKELTKQFEEIFRGKTADVLKMLSGRAIKGEYVLVVRGCQDDS